MIDSIVGQYEKHGWKLRRILLTKAELIATADDLKTQYPEAQLMESQIDALWFSRPNRDVETWELRRLSGTPFALLEVFDLVASQEHRENAILNVERRMAESLSKSNRENPRQK